MAQRGNRGAADRAPLIERTEAGWFRGDFRTWGGKRWVLRNPDHPNWAPGKRAGRKTDVHREATEWALQYVDALEYEDLPADQKVLEDLIEDFMEYRRAILPDSVGPIKRRRRVQSLKTALNHLLDDYKGSVLENVDPQRTVDRLIREGIALSTIRTYARSSLQPFFKWAGREVSLRLPKAQKDHRKEGIPDDKIEDLRTAAARQGEEWLLAVDLGLYAGLRAQEIFGANWGDIDESRGVIYVMRQADGTIPKGGKAAEVPMLNEWEHKADGRTGRVVPHESDYGAESTGARETLKTILREAGVYEYGTGWHLLRHTYARLFLERTQNIFWLKEALRHSSVTLTEKYYLHVLPSSTADRAVEAMKSDGS